MMLPHLGKTFSISSSPEAQKYPTFRLALGARRLRRLLQEGGSFAACAIAPRMDSTTSESPLTVGTDGRFSVLRRLGGFRAVSTSPAMDVVWFRLPRLPDRFGPISWAPGLDADTLWSCFPRPDDWQCGYVIPKGGYQRLRADGLEAAATLGRRVSAGVCRTRRLAGRLASAPASVGRFPDRLRRWYRPGLLLIGDAAHTMSPVGGVGINYAIRDAVVAADILAAPLLRRRPRLRDLRDIQRRCDVAGARDSVHSNADARIRSLVERLLLRKQGRCRLGLACCCGSRCCAICPAA